MVVERAGLPAHHQAENDQRRRVDMRGIGPPRAACRMFLFYRWDLAARMWERLKAQAIERAVGL
jgi:hypothetical protein